MRTRHFIGMAMVTLMVGMMALPACGNEPNIDQQKNYYLQCINAEIDTYSCKVVHVNSRSKNLQAYGENAALRTAFLSQNRGCAGAGDDRSKGQHAAACGPSVPAATFL